MPNGQSWTHTYTTNVIWTENAMFICLVILYTNNIPIFRNIFLNIYIICKYISYITEYKHTHTCICQWKKRDNEFEREQVGGTIIWGV